MGEAPDLTIEILKQIRDEMRATREELGARLDQTNARLDQTNARLDQTREELGGKLDRIVQEQIRHATAIADLRGSQREIVDAVAGLGQGQASVVAELHQLNARLDNVLLGPLGQQVRDHEQRLTALERKAG